jgi:hypothetical protein
MRQLECLGATTLYPDYDQFTPARGTPLTGHVVSVPMTRARLGSVLGGSDVVSHHGAPCTKRPRGSFGRIARRLMFHFGV